MRIIDADGVVYRNLSGSRFRDHSSGVDVFIEPFETVKIKDSALLRQQERLVLVSETKSEDLLDKVETGLSKRSRQK